MPLTLLDPIADSLEHRLADASAEDLIRWADEEFDNQLVVSTSFVIQSAVTLHLVTQIRPDVPIIWVDTGYLPQETHDYAATLKETLNLNLRVVRSAMSPAEMESRYGRLWESDREEDLNRYDQIRKVEPMQRALNTLGAVGWISGLRADQTDFRRSLPRVKRQDARYRVYPILKWNNRDVYYYMERFGLPQHPLFAQGYATVGDAHSSRPLTAGDTTERSTRFRGIKQECGLHL